MSADIASGHDVHSTHSAPIGANVNGKSRQSRAARKKRHRMTFFIVLGLLKDRRVREDLILGAITLAALARLSREHAARARARLVAWSNAG
jgi:hypothetical protein